MATPHSAYRPSYSSPTFPERALGSAPTRDIMTQRLDLMTRALGEYMRDNGIKPDSPVGRAITQFTQAYENWKKSPDGLGADMALHASLRDFERQVKLDARSSGLPPGSPLLTSLGDIAVDARGMQNDINARAREQGVELDQRQATMTQDLGPGFGATGSLPAVTGQGAPPPNRDHVFERN